MNSNSKKKNERIIAREGLILLGIVILGLTIYFISRHLNNIYVSQHWESEFKVMQKMKYRLVGFTPYLKTMSFGLNLAMFGYPIVIIVRFIIWAVRTLKGKWII